MPQHEAKFAVNAPPDEVWKFIRDIESLCACVPGVERVKLLDQRTAELTVKEKIGVIPLIVNLTAHIDAEDPPRRLHAIARAEHLTMEIEVALQPAPTGTDMSALFKVKGEGPLKAVVDRLFEKRAAERTVQFADTLEKRFGGAAAPRLDASVAPGLFERLRRWLAALWRR